MVDGQPFAVGDFICLMVEDDDDLADSKIGYVTGFCPGPQWIRVRTLDRKRRIWHKDKTNNVDFVCREGNYARTTT